jgi:hypothetical protein
MPIVSSSSNVFEMIEVNAFSYLIEEMLERVIICEKSDNEDVLINSSYYQETQKCDILGKLRDSCRNRRINMRPSFETICLQMLMITSGDLSAYS